MSSKIPTQNDIKTEYGIYSDNKFFPDDGRDPFFCISYHDLNKRIKDKIGWFNMKYRADIKAWIIFQYVLQE